MNKNEIIKELQRHNSTVLSFPDRGNWGDCRYRGNCSGWIIAFLLWKYGANSLAEIFAGGGTGYDVCRDFNIPYVGIDLNPTPTREGIVSMDILDDEIPLPDGFYKADMVFLHPPYPSINDVHYSNTMWKDETGTLKYRDIQEMSWEKGMNAVNHAVMRGYAAMPKGSYEAVLVGDVRRKGQFKSMGTELVIPGELQQVIVKMQHNTNSGYKNTTYNSYKGFVPLAHELIYVIKKPSGYELAYIVPYKCKQDIRDTAGATWKDVVFASLKQLNGCATLEQLYTEIDGHKKAANNTHWKEKVRQTLQRHDIFTSQQRGVWQIAA